MELSYRGNRWRCGHKANKALELRGVQQLLEYTSASLTPRLVISRAWLCSALDYILCGRKSTIHTVLHSIDPEGLRKLPEAVLAKLESAKLAPSMPLASSSTFVSICSARLVLVWATVPQSSKPFLSRILLWKVNRVFSLCPSSLPFTYHYPLFASSQHSQSSSCRITPATAAIHAWLCQFRH